MKDLKEAKRILGMKIERDRVKGKVSLTQKAYLQKGLRNFLLGVKPSLCVVLWPLTLSFQLECLRRL